MNMLMSTAYQFKPLFLIAGLLQGRYLSLRAVEQYATIIPIGLFAEDWRMSEVGKLVEQFAPQAYANPMD